MGTTTIEREPGAAQICIKLDNGKIIVTHTNEEVPLLFEKEAKKGDWNKLWDALKNQAIAKVIITAIILLTSLTSKSQAFIDFGGGIGGIFNSTQTDKDAGYFAPVMKISGGYQFKNFVAEGVVQPAITRKVNADCYLGAKVGYNFGGFIIPSIGYLYDYKNADDISMNKWEVAYSLKFQAEANENGGVFLEVLYAKKIEATIGFHIYLN